MPSSPYKAKPQLLGSSASSPTSKFIAASAHPSSAGASFGRITSVRLRAGCRRAPQTLIGQLTQRQYHYDALGQLIAIEAPGHTQRYGYDPAGRLRAMLSSLQPEQQTRWDIDPAGNRLPGVALEKQTSQPEWAAQVHAHWQQTQFNLLGQGNANNPSNASATRWPDNRIGYSAEHAWRYDAYGNRAEQLSEDGRRQTFTYDGAHQLIEVKVQGPVIGNANEDTAETSTTSTTSHYRYDALGRRLKKTSVISSTTAADAASESATQETTHYYGWDGDRLVHTERTHSESPEQRQISHTVYEPGSFTPLIRLSTLAGPAKPKAHALLLAVQGALHDAGDEDDTETTDQVQAMLDAMPEGTRNMLDAKLRQAAKQDLTKEAKEALADHAQNVSQRLAGMRKQLAKQKHGCETPVTIEFYHCDHLGTPIALTDDKHQVVWAARLDPWGNVQEEFNPCGMDQVIRLPGQHHDRETGLYYNRYRYYDPGIGSYINQDPIGLAGGNNYYEYAFNLPTQAYDPTGLIVPLVVLGAIAAKAATGAAIGAGVEVGMQAGKTVAGNIKDNWDEGRPLMQGATDCVDIDFGQVAVSAGIGAVAPGLFSSAKTVFTSGKAISTISGQAANTANRAAKLAARKQAHMNTIKEASTVQGVAQGAKALGKCAVAANSECPK